MKDVIDGFNVRFNIALQSNTEREFYQSLYHYFDFIHQTPDLRAIFDRNDREYSMKHSDLWKKRPMTDEEADEAEAQTIKLERFNLFAVGSAIYVRIYLPIREYRNTNEPDNEQDPVAIILLRGADYALSLKEWDAKTINLYNRWFKDRRNYYERQLRRFHIMFLDELAKPIDAVKSKPKIDFDKDVSILKIDDKVVGITLKNDKPIDHYILEYIFENKEGLKAKSYYADILKSKFPMEDFNERSLRRACTALNAKVSEQAGIAKFLKFETGKSGSVHINPDYL
jgi:hypothetical protein